MKKILLLSMIGAVLGVGADAAQKCVALDAGATGGATTYNGSYWKIVDPNGAVLRGTAVCSSNYGNMYSEGTQRTRSSVTISTTSSSNKYCWCKIISPAVSAWVNLGDCQDESDCDNYCSAGVESCANYCATALVTYSYDVREFVFDSIIYDE